jgi:hypothetical protein
MTAGADGTTADKTIGAAARHSPAAGPAADHIAAWTDQYFLKTKAVV